MFSNQKRHTPEGEEICLPASCNENSSSTDKPDSNSAMVVGFSLQSRTTRKSTGLRFTPTSSSSSIFPTPSNFQSNSNPIQSLYYTNVYSKYDDRYPTFHTWPKSHPIRPEAIARAGFIYTGHGDKVMCPWCNIKLIDWECFDIPMDEHRKHSPNCQFMLMLFPKI